MHRTLPCRDCHKAGNFGGLSDQCVACHLNGDFKKELPFAKCMDCHKDEHQGQFAKRQDRGECASCHNLDGWKPSLFDVKAHQKSAYPLEGGHAKLECMQCHIPKGKETVYKLKFALCMDCHKDDHNKQFAGEPYQNHCEKCHTLNGYSPSTFTLVKHKESSFPLTVNDIDPGDAYLTGDALGVRGQPLSYTFNVDDSSPVDSSSTFSFKVNWGDGSPVQTFHGVANLTQIQHIYQAESPPEGYTITLSDRSRARPCRSTRRIAIAIRESRPVSRSSTWRAIQSAVTAPAGTAAAAIAVQQNAATLSRAAWNEGGIPNESSGD